VIDSAATNNTDQSLFIDISYVFLSSTHTTKIRQTRMF